MSFVMIGALCALLGSAGCGDQPPAVGAGGDGGSGNGGTGGNTGGSGGEPNTGGTSGAGGLAGNPGTAGAGGMGTGGTGGMVPDLPVSTDGPCNDGVDCLCDLLAGEPSIVGCEDFEDPNLPNYSDRRGWHDLYSNGVNGCLIDASVPGKSRTQFGRSGNACIDIVQEGDCEVPGQVDCVFGGHRALDQRARQGRTGGITGTMRWPASRRFGLTMALKYSHNYITPGSGAGSGPAHKMNELGNLRHPLIGASTGNRNHPYGGAVLRMVPGGTSASFEAIVGGASTTSDTGAFRLEVDRSAYNWVDSANGQPATHGPDEWICVQQHWDGWGTASATVRAWMDGKLVMHIRNIDMRAIDKDEDGVGSLVFNNYYNGLVTPGNGRSGYPGPEVAARYEDNVVVTNATEPVSCAVIGFAGM